MVIPVRVGGLRGAKIKPLPPGLQVLYVFTVWKQGSSKVSIVVRNVSESPIYLKKGIQVTCLVPATPVPPSVPALVSEGATALEAVAEPLSVAEWQAKLLEKLDLSGLKNWAPRNAEAAEQLVLSYHDIFALERNELGCTNAVEHEICIVDSEPFKERFRRIPPESGFWQVKMAPGSQPYMAFTMGNLGFYEFTRMPFGLCSMPATFQRLMQNTLGKLNLTYCVIYLDNVIVFRHTEEEHLECLQVVFERFREFNLKLKPSKCNLFQPEIIYLAHHVSKEGVHPSKDNVHMIEEFPMPETFMQVRVFCELAGHYR